MLLAVVHAANVTATPTPTTPISPSSTIYSTIISPSQSFYEYSITFSSDKQCSAPFIEMNSTEMKYVATWVDVHYSAIVDHPVGPYRIVCDDSMSQWYHVQWPASPLDLHIINTFRVGNPILSAIEAQSSHGTMVLGAMVGTKGVDGSLEWWESLGRDTFLFSSRVIHQVGSASMFDLPGAVVVSFDASDNLTASQKVWFDAIANEARATNKWCVVLMKGPVVRRDWAGFLSLAHLILIGGCDRYERMHQIDDDGVVYGGKYYGSRPGAIVILGGGETMTEPGNYRHQIAYRSPNADDGYIKLHVEPESFLSIEWHSSRVTDQFTIFHGNAPQPIEAGTTQIHLSPEISGILVVACVFFLLFAIFVVLKISGRWQPGESVALSRMALVQIQGRGRRLLRGWRTQYARVPT